MMASTDIDPNEHDSPLGTKMPLIISERDIVFNCPACLGELVVDRDGAGLTVPCSHCGKPLMIPAFSPSRGAAEGPPVMSVTQRHFDFSGQTAEQVERRSADLKHQLKENRSQDTEMRGHVNRATMELHRLQLRLKKLEERQSDIEAELAAIKDLTLNN